ncbi:MAG: DUF3253 domain-containing protein [Casimicrobium sp.]
MIAIDSVTVRHTIVTMCEARGLERSLCPSEIARAIWPYGWREHMHEVRAAALALAHEGVIDITQRGERRDPAKDIRGAIRYRLKTKAAP